MTKKNIFVSGSHRSGSTWVGNVIAKSKKVRYVWEPFNLDIKPRNSPARYWFHHISKASLQTDKNEFHKFISSYVNILHPYNVKKLFEVRSPRSAYRHFRDVFHRFYKRTLIKDPIAILSAEWIYEEFDPKMIILIRHPAAFVASLKVTNWTFPFKDLQEQNLLINNYLHKYSVEIYEYSLDSKDIIKQGILLWNIVHDMIFYYSQKYAKEWYFVKHEDLSQNPVEEFKAIFAYLNLSFDENIKQYIISSTTSVRSSSLERDAKANIKNWKKRLTIDEIQEIKKGTGEVWNHFYSEEDW